MEQVDATAHPRLYRRGGRYYHRASVPQDIRDTYPRTEETFSLKTSDYQEALRRVRKAAYEVDQRFDEHRQSIAAKHISLDRLTEQQFKQIVDLYYAYLLRSDDEYRRENGSEDPKALFVGYEELSTQLVDIQDAYASGRIDKRFYREVPEALERLTIHPLSPESPDWQELAWRLQETFIVAAKSILKRQKGEVVPTPRKMEVVPQRSTAVLLIEPRSDELPTPVADDGAHLLSSIVDEWLAEKKRDWSAKSYNDHQTVLSNFRVIVGDKPLVQYSKADGRRFKNVLLKLPPNWTKQKALQGLSIDQAADKAHQMNMAPMSGKNLNKIIGYAAAFWNWATAHYDDAPANPLAGLKVKLNQSARNEREPFKRDELKAIFRAPLFTGCKSLHYWRQEGSTIPKQSGMFWAPLISLYSGMRMGEILQLYVADIREDEGIRYIDVNGDGEDKSLKTSSSYRAVPIHPELVRLGFLDHVEQMRQQGSVRLFPDMEMGNDGHYSSVYSKRFRALLDSLGIKRDKIAFHSFRHNFEDVCRDSGVPLEITNALQGHTEAGMAGRYGSGYTLQRLNEAMQSISYRKLDIGWPGMSG